jgi:hypothetical protein
VCFVLKRNVQSAKQPVRTGGCELRVRILEP